MKRILLIGTTLLVFVALAFAADFWNTKPYTQWSQGDAARLLTDSPWAKTTTLRTGLLSSRSGGGPQGVEDSRVEPMVQYVVSIGSALPIRQATARMAALAAKYDKMDPSAKQEFDTRWNQYLDVKFADIIVVGVDFRSNDPTKDHQLSSYFQAQTLDKMKPTTWLLLSKGKKIELKDFAAAPHQMQFVFPRPADLAPDASFTIVFRHPDVTGQSSQPINSGFSLKTMTFKGALAF